MDCVYIAASIGFVGLIFYYYLTKNYGYWAKKRIPHLKNSLPGLGNVYPVFFMRKNLLEMYKEFYDKMPGCSAVGFYNLREPALLIRDPELVKSVLQTNFSSFSKNGITIDPKSTRLLSGNPFFLEGEKWKAARQQLSSAFTSGKLKFIYQSIDTVCEKLVNYLDDKIAKGNGEVEVELKELFSRYTAEVVASAAYGVEGNSFKNDGDGTFVEIGKIIFEPSFTKGIADFATIYIPFLARIIGLSFIPSRIEKIFMNLVKDMLKYRADNNIERNDFLQLMINLKKSGATDHGFGGEFSDDTIASHAASFFFDGYETSSITLNFIGYQLASHPEIQQRVRDEVLSMIEKHNNITYEALHEMTYMDQVIQESARLYPAAGAVLKVCTNEIDLKGSDGITYRVMPKTPIVISIAGLQGDPEYWPDPEIFDPDRFTEENKQKRHKFTHIPFGEGPRACIGMRMAMLQMKAAIATILTKYTLELSPKTVVPLKLDPRYFLTSTLGGVWVKLKAL